jgi:hypothetical protein
MGTGRISNADGFGWKTAKQVGGLARKTAKQVGGLHFAPSVFPVFWHFRNQIGTIWGGKTANHTLGGLPFNHAGSDGPTSPFVPFKHAFTLSYYPSIEAWATTGRLRAAIVV